MTKYCVNCKHFSPKVGDEHHIYARCAVSTRDNPISLVTGKPHIVDLPYAEVMRMSSVKDKCGVEGQFFEEKAKPQLKYQPQYTSPFVQGDD